ncbi:MAG: hypothetical protein AAGF89_03170 [Bacteroidota bacterium]
MTRLKAFTIAMPYRLSLLFCLLSVCLLGQDEGYRTHQKITDDRIYLRWEPLSWEDFEYAIQGNLSLEAYAVGGSDLRPELRLLESRTIQPLPYENWRNALSDSPWDTIALAAVYADQLDAALREETFIAKEYEDTAEEERQARWQVSNYALGYDWQAIERSGLGWARPRDAGTARYAIRVFPTLEGDTIYYDLDLRDYSPPVIPPLEAKFRNKRAELQWRTIDAKPTFFAWHLERSISNGPFTDVFELPLINDYDSTRTVDEALKYLYHTNRFPSNADSIVYRLRGQDHLGGRSVNFSEARGKGAEDIRFAPLLTHTEQTDSNYAIIHWEYDGETIDLVREFRVVVTDSVGGTYEVALGGIAPSVREVAIPMKYRSNFFRVQAVSTQGTVYSSFESLVIAYDDEPPAMPRDFTGYIDSNGAVFLSWVTSDEFDLAGYYLFKGYYEDSELAMITPDPLPGPEHVDSVNMVTPNEVVYYQLRSVDFRGNGSNFTPILALKKPDVYPPAPPQITKIDNNNSRITLDWTTSPSPDVIAYRLFKRRLDEGEEYRLLEEWSVEDYPARYVDTLVEAGPAYGYVLQTVDDDGLISDYSQPVSIRLKDYGLLPPIQGFSATRNEDTKAIDLSWSYDQSPRDFYLYRAEEDKSMALLKVLSGEDRTFSDEGIRPKQSYRYLLRAVFADGKVSPFTEEVRVE